MGFYLLRFPPLHIFCWTRSPSTRWNGRPSA